MSKKVVFYIGFFVVLVVVFYAVMAKTIPGFSSGKLPPIGQVGSFQFVNQDGAPFGNKDVAGKVYVAEYFFTTCPGICPMMNDNMKKVYNVYKNEPGFLILSHTCDPKHDSVQRLKIYADSMKVDTRHWVFVTGRKDSLYNMARLSYQIDDPANNLKSEEDDFMHTQFWALVNRKGEVLKIYDGLKQDEIDQLIKDIAATLKDS